MPLCAELHGDRTFPDVKASATYQDGQLTVHAESYTPDSGTGLALEYDVRPEGTPTFYLSLVRPAPGMVSAEVLTESQCSQSFPVAAERLAGGVVLLKLSFSPVTAGDANVIETIELPVQ